MSGRMYQVHDWMEPYILRVDIRPDDPVTQDLFKEPQRNITVAIKKQFNQAHYRLACLAGEMHPLKIEYEHYELITVARRDVKSGGFDQSKSNPGYSRANRFTSIELDFIASVQREPEVEWAVDNSFDGMYIQKYEDFSSLATVFQFAVYLQTKQATFWRLKFSGQ